MLISNNTRMKRLILFLALPLLATLSLKAQTPAPAAATSTATAKANPNAPVAKFDMMVNDLGDIEFNVPKTAEFKLTNTGKEPLIINSARASCGCTNVKYSPEPILPGKSAIVSATYNAASQGTFIKTLTVVTNAGADPIVLQIKGNVLPKK